MEIVLNTDELLDSSEQASLERILEIEKDEDELKKLLTDISRTALIEYLEMILGKSFLQVHQKLKKEDFTC